MTVGSFSSHPLVFGRDDELLVLLGHHAAGAVGALQHVDDQVIGQHVQLLLVVPGDVDRAGQAVSAGTNQQPRLVISCTINYLHLVSNNDVLCVVT